MATLSFEGETNSEIAQKMRRWLAAQDGGDDVAPTLAETLTQGAEVTKDALRIIASAAPDPVAQSDVVKGLTGMGYKATDATKDAVIAGLDSIEEATGGGVVRQVSTAGRKAVYEMNSQIAKQLLKNLMG
ncbi:MAG: hypothetical protein R2714_16980 [Microthrixaceae bacterium]|nr:hypothetical protein [Microthrixaceae bacterium]MCO5322952.1 hypothetical protein [Microthrixaceae bacterium]